MFNEDNIWFVRGVNCFIWLGRSLTVKLEQVSLKSLKQLKDRRRFADVVHMFLCQVLKIKSSSCPTLKLLTLNHVRVFAASVAKVWSLKPGQCFTAFTQSSMNPVKDVYMNSEQNTCWCLTSVQYYYNTVVLWNQPVNSYTRGIQVQYRV